MTDEYFAPILNVDGLIPIVEMARVQGRPIILANGCFDLIHAGHIRYLAGAKALGGLLIVGINSDRQVRHLKGAGRPFIPDTERAEIVSAFRFVDAVIIFDKPDVEDLIHSLRPNIHAKGTDYTEDTVPEREVIKLYGGRVAIVGDPKDHSSTDLIEKVTASGSSDTPDA